MIDISKLTKIDTDGLLDISNITVFLIEDRGTKKEPIGIYNLNIDSKVMTSIRSATKKYMDEIVKMIKDEEIKSIPDYNPDHSQIIFQIQKETVDAQDFTTLKAFLSGVKASIPFKKEKIKEDKLKAWVFRFEYEKEHEIKQIYFFQKFQASKMLGAKKISIFQVGGEFVLLDNYLLTINETMDFLLYEDTFVVTKMVAFEKIFGYEAFYKENATVLVTTLEKKAFPGLDYQVTFSDQKSLESTINKIQESTRIAHKLYSAKKNGYYKKIKFEKLEELNNQYLLGLELDATSKEWTIDENSNLFVVSQILNDDYGISQLTELEYLAIMKERLQRPKIAPTKTETAVTYEGEKEPV